jgi:hypothetical protein
MNTETIFNIFPICNDDIISAIGFRVHELAGTDEEKINFLLSRVETDVKEMAYIKISDNFKVILPTGEEVAGVTKERFNNLLHNGTEQILYEPIFQIFDAPQSPLSVSTMFVDGEIKITSSVEFEAVPKTKFTEKITESIPEHYLSKFMTDEGVNLGDLINEDFIEGIRLMFQNHKYVSCSKLLMSAVDTFAFLEFGDVRDNFKNWLTKYCDLSLVKVTPDELWEYRNSILHMTNSRSRKVLQNDVQRLAFYVSDSEVDFMTTNGEANYFNLLTLINLVNKGIENWCNSYNDDRSKFEDFVDRYDSIISDSRYNKIHDTAQQ